MGLVIKTIRGKSIQLFTPGLFWSPGKRGKIRSLAVSLVKSQYPCLLQTFSHT